MNQIRTARELYCEILKSFYFGVYRREDKFMTYQETHEIYGLAKNTIGKAYGMLQRDGLIRTDGTNGTIVTFDPNNPEHVAKVPLEWPGATPEDTIPYQVAMQLHAYSLYTGLIHSNEIQLRKCKKMVEEILQCIKNGCPYSEQVLAFWMSVISSLDNEFLNRITDHFISRYLYLLPSTHLSSIQRRLIGDSAREYYEFLLDAIERHEFEAFPARFEQHYHNYYKHGGVVFSKLEDGGIFKEQALYGRLLEELCIKIMSGELQKGDNLPTTKQLCAEYSISKTTVNRAYGILTDMGLISRRVRSGTRLIAEPNDLDIWQTLEKAAGVYQPNWKDAVDVILIINSALSRRIVIGPDVVGQMQTELARQCKLFERYTTPYFVSAVLFNPLITSLPAGILHKYFIELVDTLNKGITLCTFRVHENEEHGEEIYQLMCDALGALQHGNQELFAVLSKRAMLRNVALLTEDYVSATNNFVNK